MGLSLGSRTPGAAMSPQVVLLLILASAGCIGYAATKLRYGVDSPVEFGLLVATVVVGATSILLTIHALTQP